MTKFRIQVLIGLMGAAAVGLLAFQWFWIDNALRLRQEQFSLKVTDALQEVVRKLEKQEILYLVQQRQQSEQQRLKLATIDKNNAAKRAKRKQYASAPAVTEEKSNLLVETNPTDALTPKNRLLTHGQQQLISDFLKQRAAEDPVAEHFLRMRAEQEKFLNEWFGEFFEIRTQFWESAAQTDSLPNTTLFGNLPNSAQILNKRIRKIKANAAQFDQPLPSALSSQTDPTNQQAQLLKDVFRDLLFGQRPIAHRVNRLMMDSLLKKAFQERSITIPYDFAVRSQRSAAVVFANATFRADTAPNDLFKTALFPNELNTNLSELLVYFPGRRGFILENLGLPLASSIGLLAIILGCFYMAVNTILRQKKLAQVKNDFVNNMTHEFKTPISTIALAVEMAREQISDALPNKLNRYLNIVKEENKRLGEHVEKVLQMALLERGAVRLNLTTVNVHDVIEKVLNNVGVQLEQRPTEIELEFEATQEYIQADELHLTNILYNLIDNANKYSPEQLHLYIGTRSNEEGVYVRISDHGQGMTKEQLARIFEPFYRVPTGNLHDVKGFGLGLSYVKKMLEAHHGTIEVSSQPNKGSTFELFLPYQKND